MFSGIVETMARVVAIEQDKDNKHFTLECSFGHELKIDQSVAHNGVCLTVVHLRNVRSRSASSPLPMNTLTSMP